MAFPFLSNMTSPSYHLKNAKMILSQKNTLKVAFLISLKIIIFILENMVFLLIKKLKIINCTFVKML